MNIFASSLLKNITAIALIGTQRQSFTPIATEGDLGKLLANIDATNQESALLDTISSITLYAKAGQLPLQDHTSLGSPCDLEDLPRCSDRTDHYLSLMINGDRDPALPNLLQALADAGQRVNERNLPALLSLGKRHSELREAIARVVGKRGQWLAAQNPEWNYLAGDNDDAALWDTGSKASRLLWLTKLRRQAPQQARQKLESSWKQESASDRTAFLELCITNLSMEDEPFLESLLDDRSKEVRRTAINLLTYLPESRFVQRAIARIENLIKLERIKDQKDRHYFTVELPNSHTAEMARDGIEAKSADSQVGDRASWFFQDLIAVPLSFWHQQFTLSTEDLIQAAHHPQSDRLILQGWITIAQKTQDLAWLQGLVDLNNPEITNKIANLTLANSIPPQVSNDNQQAAWIYLIKHPAIAFSNLHHSLLFSKQAVWNLEISEIVLELIIRHIESFINNSLSMHQTSNYWTVKEFIQNSSQYMARSSFPIAKAKALAINQKLQEASHNSDNPQELKQWGYVQNAFKNAIKKFIDVLQLRQEMLESITDDGVSL